MSILEEIAEKTRERVNSQKEKVSMESIKAQAMQMIHNSNEKKDTLYSALSKQGIHLICEVKKASPSKGIIAEEFPYLDIAKDYEAGGASGISVLTEPFYFLGSDAYLREIRKKVLLPILRKDFIVDDYQIYETRVLGADACLLICSLLDYETLKRRIELAKSLSLSVLVETHNEDEIKMALKAGANIIGVNNRNLADFTVDVNHSSNLRKMVPKEVVFVSESGIKYPEQIRALEQLGVNAVLIGETLMRSEDRVNAVKEFKGR